MADTHMEDGEKIGEAQEVMDAEHELAHNKEATKDDLIRAYQEEKEEEAQEKKKEVKENKEKVIEERNKFSKN